MMPSTKCSTLYVLSLCLLLALHATTTAQSVTDGATPLGLSPGMPAGSYALGDFDAVNLYNGNLGFRLPLLGIARQFDPNKQLMDVQTKQDAVVKSGTTNLFMVQGTQIRMNDASKSITYKQGPVRNFGN